MAGMIPEGESEEKVWIARSVAGDREAFGLLVRRHQGFAVGVAYRMTGQADLAEDIAQEAFIKAWLNLPRYRGQGSFRAWLGRIVSNLAIDGLRRRKLEKEFNEELFQGGRSPPSLVIQAEQAQIVRQAVLALPVQSRAALILREYGEMSYKEIAEALDIPIGTVMSRLNYARARLREMLRPELFRLETSPGETTRS